MNSQVRRAATSIVCVLFCMAGMESCRHRSRASQGRKAPQAGRSTAVRQLPPLAVGYSEEGVASWYGVPYDGRPAADGEIYNMDTLVAAHRTMPFNTWVRVTNLSNGKVVDVRVIDRGPFVGNRIIDLSRAAARQLDLIGPGTGAVRLEVISAPVDVALNDFYAVQAGAFAVYENAERLRASYADRFGTAQLTMKQGTAPLYRVLVGKVGSLAAAQALADQLRSEVAGGVFIVRLDQTIPRAPVPAAEKPMVRRD